MMKPMADREELLALYRGLRLADVRDGLDALGLHQVGTVDPSIRPLWRTRAFGIARTARYLPFQGRVEWTSAAQYAEWSGWYYGAICTYPWVESLQPGDFVCLDLSGVNAGLMGSENTLGCLRRGAAGFASTDGMRDTDELILQKVPFWSRICSQGMVQGRVQFESMDAPIALGGQAVFPGDVVVADGDGVLVVPKHAAWDAARLAREEMERDMKARRSHYEALGMAPDETVA